MPKCDNMLSKDNGAAYRSTPLYEDQGETNKQNHELKEQRELVGIVCDDCPLFLNCVITVSSITWAIYWPMSKKWCLMLRSLPSLTESTPSHWEIRQWRLDPEPFTELGKGSWTSLFWQILQNAFIRANFLKTHLTCNPFKIYWTTHPIMLAEFPL